MNIKGCFVKIIFYFFKPDIVAANNLFAPRKLASWLLPEVVPEKYVKIFRSLESNFNARLSRYSLRTSAGRFAPEKAYKQWASGNQMLAQKFKECKNDMILSYDTFGKLMQESNKEFIANAWVQLFPNSGRPTDNFILETNKKILDLLPSKENLYNSVDFKMLVFKMADPSGDPDMVAGNELLAGQIKADLADVVSNTFDKIICFYGKKRQIRPNMLESFGKEIARISLLYFCRDLEDIVLQIRSMLKNNIYISDPSGFIDGLSSIKEGLTKEIARYS